MISCSVTCEPDQRVIIAHSGFAIFFTCCTSWFTMTRLGTASRNVCALAAAALLLQAVVLLGQYGDEQDGSESYLTRAAISTSDQIPQQAFARGETLLRDREERGVAVQQGQAAGEDFTSQWLPLNHTPPLNATLQALLRHVRGREAQARADVADWERRGNPWPPRVTAPAWLLRRMQEAPLNEEVYGRVERGGAGLRDGEVVVLYVHKRAWYLNITLHALAQVEGINRTLLIVR